MASSSSVPYLEGHTDEKDQVEGIHGEIALLALSDDGQGLENQKNARRVAIEDYLKEKVPEFAKLQTLRLKGWKNPEGDTFFQKQREAADNANEKTEHAFFTLMKKIARELHKSTRAFEIKTAGIGKGRILDMCMAPGGFLEVALDINWKSRALGFSLPEGDGGHKLRISQPEHVDQRWLDITMLAGDMGKSDIPPEHPDFENLVQQRQFEPDDEFDLAFCDGQVLRTHRRAEYREEFEARRLAVTQLALGLEHLKPGGTMIVLLHRPEAWNTILLLRTFSKFSDVKLRKPGSGHTTRSSFYMVATRVRSKHPRALESIALWKRQWDAATFSMGDGSLEALREEEPVVEDVLGDFGHELVRLGRKVWEIQGNALEKAPFIKGK